MKYTDIERIVAETLEVVSVIGVDLKNEELFNRTVYYVSERMKKWRNNEKISNIAENNKFKETPKCGYARLN